MTRAQLLDLGFNDNAIAHRISVGGLHRVHHGVYAVGHPPIQPLEKAMAAVLACGERAFLAHRSGLSLWALVADWRFPLHVVLMAGDRRPSRIIVHRSRTLTRADVTRERGIPVTTPARTILDCAPDLTPRRIVRLVQSARRARILTLDQLDRALSRAPMHPGAAAIRAITIAPGGPSRSEFEDTFAEFCSTFGLPTPVVNTELIGFEADAYFPVERVIVELDGWDFHNDRLSFETDRERDAAHLALGVVTVRITWERLKGTPAREAKRLRRILENRRRAEAA